MIDSTPHTVSATFTFKDMESKNKFIDFCNGETGLSVTIAKQGCQSIECYESHENSNQVTIWQKWDSQKDHENYVQFRHEDGSFEFLGELLESPPQIVPLRPVNFNTDEEQIKKVIEDMCHKDHNVGLKHMHDSCLFVRPTGNPLDMNGWNQMMNNADVTMESNELLKINKLEISGNMAYVCYTSHGKFNFKGTENNDVAVLTSVLQKIEGKWWVMFGQRSTGRSPEEEMPAFP